MCIRRGMAEEMEEKEHLAELSILRLDPGVRRDLNLGPD